MKKKQQSPVDRDVMKRIRQDPKFAENYFEELSERPFAVQRSILKRMSGEKLDSVEKLKKLWRGKSAREIHCIVLHSKRKGLI